MVTILRSRDVIHRGPASFWYMIHVFILVIISVLKKDITFWLTLICMYAHLCMIMFICVYAFVCMCVCVCVCVCMLSILTCFNKVKVVEYVCMHTCVQREWVCVLLIRHFVKCEVKEVVCVQAYLCMIVCMCVYVCYPSDFFNLRWKDLIKIQFLLINIWLMKLMRLVHLLMFSNLFELFLKQLTTLTSRDDMKENILKILMLQKIKINAWKAFDMEKMHSTVYFLIIL